MRFADRRSRGLCDGTPRWLSAGSVSETYHPETPLEFTVSREDTPFDLTLQMEAASILERLLRQRNLQARLKDYVAHFSWRSPPPLMRNTLEAAAYSRRQIIFVRCEALDRRRAGCGRAGQVRIRYPSSHQRADNLRRLTAQILHGGDQELRIEQK